MTIPSIIQKALESQARTNHSSASLRMHRADSSQVSAGDIRLIRWAGHDQYRHVLVVSVDSEASACEVLLLHSDVALATEHDIILSRDETKAPYVLVAQTDVRGIVWTVDLEHAVGAVSNVKSRFDLVLSERMPERDLRGVALAGPLDFRWQFKRREGEILAEIAESCTVDSLAGDQVFRISSTVLQLLPELETHQFETARDAIAELMIERRLLVSANSDEDDVAKTLFGSKWAVRDAKFGHEFLPILLLERLLESLTAGSDEQQISEIVDLEMKDLISV